VRKTLGVLAVLILLVAGCGRERVKPAEKPSEKATEQPKTQSAIRDAVDTVLIQKPAIDAGQRARKQLQAIDADRQKQMKESGEP